MKSLKPFIRGSFSWKTRMPCSASSSPALSEGCCSPVLAISAFASGAAPSATTALSVTTLALALLSAAAAGEAWLFPPVVAAILLAGTSVLLTGAIHLDGLADCADAFYGGRDKEAVLRILKDPRIGTMGGAALGLSLLLRAAAFASIPSGVLILALPVVSMFSRSTVLAAMRVLP